MSKSVANGLECIQQVLTIAVDGLTEQRARSGLLQKLGVDERVFFDELYVPRPETERKLREWMLLGERKISVVAPRGIGKSTLLHKVLRDVSQKTKIPKIVIDALALEGKDKESPIDLIEGEVKRTIELWLKERLNKLPSSAKYFEKRPLINILLTNDAQPFIRCPTAQTAIQKLRTQYELSPERVGSNIGLAEWVELVLENGAHPNRVIISSLMAELEMGLGLAELAYALREVCALESGGADRYKLVVAIDNLDSLRGPQLRKRFVEWMKDGSTSFRAVVVFIACIRPENVQQFLGSASFRDESALWDQDSCLNLTMAIDPTDLPQAILNDWHVDVQKNLTDAWHWEEEPLIQSEQENARAAFEHAMHIKRVEFLKRAINNRKLEDHYEAGDLKAAAAAVREVLDCGAVVRDMRMQANGNRRDLLTGICGFLRYLVVNHELDWGRIGGTQDRASLRRKMSIRSLYYKWLGAQRHDSLEPILFDKAVFDPVLWVYSCWRMDPNSRKLVLRGNSADVVRSCKNLLILIGVFNACGNTLSAWNENAAYVSTVASACEKLGLSSGDTYAAIQGMVRTIEHRHGAIFDIDLFLSVHNGSRDINGGERIVATDRCRRLATVVMFMFNYLCERMRYIVGNRGSDIVESKSLLERGLVAADIVRFFPYWLGQFAPIECMWIEHIHLTQSGIGSLSKAFREYCDKFLVKRSHADQDLISRIMANTALRYIKFALEEQIRDDEEELRNAYQFAERALTSIEQRLFVGIEALVKNNVWRIPKDQPLSWT